MTVGMVLAAAIGAAPRAGAAGTTGNDGMRREVCRQVLSGPPPGGVALRTDPPDGATVVPGQRVRVTLRWGRRAFAGDSLRRVAWCVNADGRPVEALGGFEAPSPNDGEFSATYVVPDAAPPGSCLCVRGVATGDASNGGLERQGGLSCLTVVKPPTPPATAPPGPPVTSPPRPPAEIPPTQVLPAKETIDTGTQTKPAPDQVLPATGNRPVPLRELPRTGPVPIRLLLAVAGLALVFGGGAQFFGGGAAARR